MPSELSFSTFLSGQQQEPVTNETQETSVVESQEAASGTEATTQIENQEQVAPSIAVAPVSLAALLEAKGVQVEGGDSEELYESVVSRALAGSQAMSELAQLRGELEALRAAAQQPSTAPQNTVATPTSPQNTEGETTAQQQARLFRELQKYDPLLENYVERDETGYAKPVASYGQLSIDAARKINEYQQASREQADRILRNPLSIVEDSRDMITKIAEERAQRIIDERLAAMQAEQARITQEQAAAEQQKSFEQQQYEWHEANKAKLFHLGPDGEPKKDVFGSGGLAMTSTGQRFMLKLNQLREQLPSAPELTLRNLAIEFATAGQPQSQPAATPAPAPVTNEESPAPVLTQSQQRQNLLSQNRQSVPNTNTPTADIHQIMQSAPRLRLAEMAQMDPANAERISGWRR